MNLHLPALRWIALPQRIRGAFNLNDQRWGRGGDGDKSSGSGGDDAEEDRDTRRPDRPDNSDPWDVGERDRRSGGRNNQQGNEPPDLDELWKDLNRKLGSIFGSGGKRRNDTPGDGGSGPGGSSARPKDAAPMLVIVAALAAAAWLMYDSIFIVKEGDQAVITQFGKYNKTVGAGLHFRWPSPIQRHETVAVTQLRAEAIGQDKVVEATGLNDSGMLTLDENIVEIKFSVQYRLNDARAFLFESDNPIKTVAQAAETAVRDVVGKMTMDQVLTEERDQIAPRVLNLMQIILDRYKIGVEIVNVNLQQGGVNPPIQVQAAFDDVLKAGQERERIKNEAESYANDVIPRAQGEASRLIEAAKGYKARIVAQAEGDTQRFSAVLAEYQKAPKVTRDRMYIDAMQQIYTNVTKVLVDAGAGSNLLYMPLDKLLQTPDGALENPEAGSANGSSGSGQSSGSASESTVPAAASAAHNDMRGSRGDLSRNR